MSLGLCSQKIVALQNLNMIGLLAWRA